MTEYSEWKRKPSKRRENSGNGKNFQKRKVVYEMLQRSFCSLRKAQFDPIKDKREKNNVLKDNLCGEFSRRKEKPERIRICANKEDLIDLFNRLTTHANAKITQEIRSSRHYYKTHKMYEFI